MDNNYRVIEYIWGGMPQRILFAGERQAAVEFFDKKRPDYAGGKFYLCIVAPEVLLGDFLKKPVDDSHTGPIPLLDTHKNACPAHERRKVVLPVGSD
jgi:hypothetical protein